MKTLWQGRDGGRYFIRGLSFRDKDRIRTPNDVRGGKSRGTESESVVGGPFGSPTLASTTSPTAPQHPMSK